MGRTKTALLNPIHTNMTLEEIEQIPVVEEQELAPIPDGKKKAKKAKKAKKSQESQKGQEGQEEVRAKGTKVRAFILGKVLLRLNRRRVLKKTKRGYRLTGRALPKPRTLAQKRAAMAKARRSLGKKKRGGKKVAKKSKKAKKSKRTRRTRRK